VSFDTLTTKTVPTERTFSLLNILFKGIVSRGFNPCTWVGPIEMQWKTPKGRLLKHYSSRCINFGYMCVALCLLEPSLCAKVCPWHIQAQRWMLSL
jgi:hypothetical protein